MNNRPLSFVDPTGHIDQNQVGDAEDILKELALYGVDIVVDWGWLVSSKNIWSWNKGLWELGELNTLLSGVQSLAKAMGGENNFRNNLGGVKVEQKIMTDGGLGDAHHVQLNDTGWGEWTVVHEFVHAWDATTGWQKSKDFEKFTGGYSNCFLSWCWAYHPGGTPAKGADASLNRVEDFAESVTTFVYPSTAQNELRGPTFRGHPEFQYDNYYSMPRAQFVAQQLGVNLGEFTLKHQ